MYITQATIDNTRTFEELTYTGSDIDSVLVGDLVRKLDGDLHTLVTLTPGGDEHMAIGGDAQVGLVVYRTSDNMSFDNLLSTQPSNDEARVPLMAGGQPGEYKPRYVVSVEAAVSAATTYAESGMLATELSWETT